MKPQAKSNAQGKAKADAKAKPKAKAKAAPGDGAPKSQGAAPTAPSASGPDPKYEAIRMRKDVLGKTICCYHAVYGKCNKNNECEFSHAPALKLNDADVAIVKAEWKRRADRRARSASPGQKKGFSACRYFNSPTGCNRENCSFKHEKGAAQ